MKKLFLILLFSFLSVKNIYAKESTVLIINQVRGDEICCQAGSLNLLKEVKDKKFADELFLGWALRYDALKNEEYLRYLQNLGEFGLLLEVTPNLARDSNIYYKGRENGSDWYLAKNAFLVGYSQDERKKIIDTLFEVFKKKFGYYPKFTVSWMIDSWSLSYINQTYQVELHEITREQYETDSYTLYGGIFNFPYYPSKSHPLIPGSGKNKLDLIMVRQTVSDPLFNYGSSKAYFTSQPNDYLENPEKKNITYFQELINSAISQDSEFDFIILGLENSLSWEKYGAEYLKQLTFVKKLQKENKIRVKKPSDFIIEFKEKISSNKTFYLANNFSADSNYGSLWYFGNSYRARIVIKDDKMIIDDLRVFLPIVEPYEKSPVVADYAYWIVPYLIDGSQQYFITPKQEKNIEKKDLLYSSTISDYYTNPFGITINKKSFSLVKIDNDNGVEIRFSDQNNGSIRLLPDSILFDSKLEPYFNKDDIFFSDLFTAKDNKKILFRKHFDFYLKYDNSERFQLGWSRDNNFFPLFHLSKKGNYFNLSPYRDTGNLDYLNPIFQPDKSDLTVEPEISIFYWNNKKAITGRNPVRLFILPLNMLGRPTRIRKIELKSDKKNLLKIVYPEDYFFRVSPWFIDINADIPVKAKISILIDDKIVIEQEDIEFIADCRKNIGQCLTSWPQIIKYMVIIAEEQKNKLIPVIKNLWKI